MRWNPFRKRPQQQEIGMRPISFEFRDGAAIYRVGDETLNFDRIDQKTAEHLSRFLDRVFDAGVAEGSAVRHSCRPFDLRAALLGAPLVTLGGRRVVGFRHRDDPHADAPYEAVIVGGIKHAFDSHGKRNSGDPLDDLYIDSGITSLLGENERLRAELRALRGEEGEPV